MNTTLANFVARVARQSRVILNSYAASRELDVLFSGTPNYTGLITQEMLDEVPAFVEAGLTVAQLGAVVYMLKMVNVQIDTIDFPALTIVANIDKSAL